MEKGGSINSLIRQEMALQSVDRKLATTKDQIASIETAQRDYRQLCVYVGEMRREPLAYLRMAMGQPNTKGDYRVVPDSFGLKQLRSNRTRLKNRAIFASEDQRPILDARIKLARRSIARLKLAHEKLTEKHKVYFDAFMKLSSEEILDGKHL